MVYIQTQRDGATVFKPWGDLNRYTSMVLRQAIHNALVPGADIVIDLLRVPSIDAVGCSVLVGCLHQARDIGATISLRNELPAIQRRFELLLIQAPRESTFSAPSLQASV